MSEIVLQSRTQCFGGWVEYYSHFSQACQSTMRFSVYLPPAAQKRPVPVLYWLSGLTCSEENFMVKAGAQRIAAELGVMIVAPDTSPRGLNLPHETDSWDFGLAAGFYVNATTAPWSKHYRMYDYAATELPTLVANQFRTTGKESISGHSMGGHGALVLALRQPQRFASVSAFAPIVAPCQVPWGKKAFTGYLGEDTSEWKAYDACALVASDLSRRPELFIDQGLSDKFLEEQLRPQLLLDVAKANAHPVLYKAREGYDHSYYYIASFIEEHLLYHSQHLS
jgi:S-formylglutathione hydrolase